MAGLRASGPRADPAAWPPAPVGLLETGTFAAEEEEVEAGANEDEEATVDDNGPACLRAATSFARAA